jgi:branched-chain amino acid transport system permease protein
MDWVTFSQTLINALMLGMTYMLIASGLTLTYGVMRLLNFAHGELYMLGAYIVFYIFGQLGFNYFLAMLAAALVCGLCGIVIERVLFRPLVGQIIPQMVLGLGISTALAGIALIAFGEKEKGMPHVFTGVFQVYGVTISVERVAVILFSAAIMFGLTMLLARTKVGYAMRAVAEDQQAAKMQGISMPRTNMQCFGLSCLLAGVSGALLAPLFYIDPFMGGHAFLTSVVVILLGGLGSIPGAAAGGLVLGMVHGFGYTYIGSIAELFGFIIIYLILLLRPQGLLGHE